MISSDRDDKELDVLWTGAHTNRRDKPVPRVSGRLFGSSLSMAGRVVHIRGVLGVSVWCALMVMSVGCFERRIGDSCAYTGGHESTHCDEGMCIADICREPAHKGEECLSHSHCVDPGTHCYRLSSSELGGVCAPYVDEGEACLWTYAICDPEQKLFCYQNICTALQPEGAGCRLAWTSCQSGFYCVPPDGLPFENLSTLDRESGICQPGQEQDGLCNIQMKVGCAEGYICSVDQLNTCQLEGTTR